MGNKIFNTEKKQYMGKQMFTIAMFFFNERSMVSQHVLAELNISTTAHFGGHETEDWAGIPVVVIFGDDYQLPPPVTGICLALLPIP